MNMLQMSEAMRDGRSISLKSQTQLIIALSIPAILEQLVMTLMSYIDTAMVGSLGPGATAAIGVVASSIWLMNGLTSAIAVGFSVQIAQYLGAGRDGDSGSNGWKRRDSGGHGGRTCSGRNRADSGRWNSRGRGSRQSGRGGAHQYDRCQYRLCFGNEIKP